jgi:hypothetical protein
VITNNDKKEIVVAVIIDNSDRTLVFVSPENCHEQKAGSEITVPALSAVVVLEK